MKVLLIILLSCSIAAAASILVLSGNTPPISSGSNVTYDTSATSGVIESINPYTVSITVASNANRLLVVTISEADTTDADEVVSSVSSNVSGAFTFKAADANSWPRAEVWYLVNPAAGAHVITITTAGLCLQSAAHAVSLYGVDQSTPMGTAATAGTGGATSAAPTASVTLGADDMALAGLSTDSEASLTWTLGTARQTTLNIAGDTALGTATRTGTGSIALTAATGNETYALVVVPINGAP